jgi:hypothetical protein
LTEGKRNRVCERGIWDILGVRGHIYAACLRSWGITGSSEYLETSSCTSAHPPYMCRCA